MYKDNDILELIDLPPYGSFPTRGAEKVSHDLPVRAAYFVTEGRGRAQRIVGVVYTADDSSYYVQFQEAYNDLGKHTETNALVSQAFLIQDALPTSGRTRDISEIQSKLRPIPEQGKSSVIAALTAALARDNQLRPGANPSDFPAFKVA